MNRGEALIKIGELEDRYCKGCQTWEDNGGNMNNQSKAARYCREQCSIGKQIREFGHVVCPAFTVKNRTGKRGRPKK